MQLSRSEHAWFSPSVKTWASSEELYKKPPWRSCHCEQQTPTRSDRPESRRTDRQEDRTETSKQTKTKARRRSETQADWRRKTKTVLLKSSLKRFFLEPILQQSFSGPQKSIASILLSELYWYAVTKTKQKKAQNLKHSWCLLLYVICRIPDL